MSEKICPLITSGVFGTVEGIKTVQGTKGVNCLKSDCAWWVETYWNTVGGVHLEQKPRCCAIKLLAERG